MDNFYGLMQGLIANVTYSQRIDSRWKLREIELSVVIRNRMQGPTLYRQVSLRQRLSLLVENFALYRKAVLVTVLVTVLGIFLGPGWHNYGQSHHQEAEVMDNVHACFTI